MIKKIDRNNFHESIYRPSKRTFRSLARTPVELAKRRNAPSPSTTALAHFSRHIIVDRRPRGGLAARVFTSGALIESRRERCNIIPVLSRVR